MRKHACGMSIDALVRHEIMLIFYVSISLLIHVIRILSKILM